MGSSSPAPSPSGPARPLRLRLLLLAASGMLPLVLLLGWGVNHLIEEQRAAAYRGVLDLSRALATAVDTELHAAQAVLETLALSDELEQGDLRGFYLSARRTVDRMGWRQMTLTDGAGRMLMRTADPMGTLAFPVLEPESVRRVIETRAPAVSRVLRSPDDKRESFAVRIPVMRSGELVYVLSAVIHTELVLNVLTRQKIPEGSVATVLDQDGNRAARSRNARTSGPSPSLKALLSQGGLQGVGLTDTSEGVRSYTGFTRLPSGWVVAVGSSVADIDKGLNGLTLAIVVGLAASMLFSILLAWVMARRVVGPVEALERAATALGRGDTVTLDPIAIEELRPVAEALQRAAADRDSAAEERSRLTAQLQDALHRAEDASRSKDEFMAMLGHELRNPLAPIATAVEVMALKGDPSTAAERRIIERQLVHVTRLVDDLLDISRITSGRLAIRSEPVAIGPLLGQAVESLRPSIVQRELALSMDKAVETAWVAGDEVRLAQVVNNLLVNAVKFSLPGGHIRVRAAVVRERVEIAVEDDGAGIAPADLERIFELFYQAPQSTERSRGGLGLGLPIVRNLVQLQGGTVRAESAGHGRGSRFIASFPLCAPPQAAPITPAPDDAHGLARVLVVDDNQDAADTCATFLEMNGMQVRTAYTPQDALAQLARAPADVAILDIGLPGMTGYELAARMREAGYAGRLVALTGYGQASDKALALHQGFDAHLTKPVAPADLLALVVRLASAGTVAPA